MKEPTKFWKNKRVLLTGGNGFLGSHVSKELETRGALEIIIPNSETQDLTKENVRKSIVKNVDLIIHLAAVVGGIGFNRRSAGRIFYDNAIMGIGLMHEAYLAGVKKFVAIGTVCAYPKFTPIPFKEDDIWAGYPEETNAPYGLAKKMMLVQAQAYRDEYNYNAIYLLPVNLYGPRDNFDPKSSHVIPALIRKFVEAKRNKSKSVTVWGTGKPTREFLYVTDAARAIVRATEHYNKPEPVNLGSGFEISIRELVEVIAELTDFKGKIVWDSSKPDGQPRRKLDTSRAKEEFGFEAKVNFQTGLKKTIKWFEKNY